MALNLVDIRNSVINYLDKNNTSTSDNDISVGLQKRVQVIKKGKADKTAIPNHLYPAILCYIPETNEELASLGQGALRKHEIQIVVEAITMYGIGVSQGDSEDEHMILSQNITSLLRQDMTMSSTVNMINNVTATYDDIMQNDNFANYVATINIFSEKFTK